MKSETIVILALIALIWWLLKGADTSRPLPPKPTHEQAAPTAKVLPGPGGLQADIERAAS